MKPKTYLDQQYQLDLELFEDVSNGDLDLCPLTLSNYLKVRRLQECTSLDSFFAYQYCLNLVAQAVHSYFPSSFFMAGDYLDVQGCYSHSFRAGQTSRPVDLIHYLEDRGIKIPMEMLNEYTEYFVTELMSKYLPEVSISDFSRILLSDNDCVEIQPCLKRILDKNEQGF